MHGPHAATGAIPSPRKWPVLLVFKPEAVWLTAVYSPTGWAVAVALTNAIALMKASDRKTLARMRASILHLGKDQLRRGGLMPIRRRARRSSYRRRSRLQLWERDGYDRTEQTQRRQ